MKIHSEDSIIGLNCFPILAENNMLFSYLWKTSVGSFRSKHVLFKKLCSLHRGNRSSMRQVFQPASSEGLSSGIVRALRRSLSFNFALSASLSLPECSNTESVLRCELESSFEFETIYYAEVK